MGTRVAGQHPDTSGASVFDTVTPPARRRLLVAALECFSDVGYAATRTRDISVGAGMSPAALYVHFASKEAVLFEISRLAHTVALGHVRETAAGITDPPDRVWAWVREFTRWHAENLKLARVAQYELAALSEEHRKIVGRARREIRAMLRQEIEAGVAGGCFTVPEVPGATLAILSLGVDVARWFVPGGRLGTARLADMYAELAMQLLGCQRTAPR